jgi:hypothetical protein
MKDEFSSPKVRDPDDFPPVAIEVCAMSRRWVSNKIVILWFILAITVNGGIRCKASEGQAQTASGNLPTAISLHVPVTYWHVDI